MADGSNPVLPPLLFQSPSFLGAFKVEMREKIWRSESLIFLYSAPTPCTVMSKDDKLKKQAATFVLINRIAVLQPTTSMFIGSFSCNLEGSWLGLTKLYLH